MIITDKDWIIKFLSGKQCDYKGRVYEDILFCSDQEMELCHDQVQWIFPLHEPSKFALTYPMINGEIAEECKKNAEIIENISNAIERMKDFYGLDPQDRKKQKVWCKEFNHNLLRVTRIIRSARIFGLENEADEFYRLAKEAGDFYCIGNVPKAYWWRARHEDIYRSLK
jgi:hypothetical protein